MVSFPRIVLLPSSVVEAVTKPEGFSVPRDVEDLVAKLQEQRKELTVEHRELMKGYESYLRFCKSVSIDPESVQPDSMIPDISILTSDLQPQLGITEFQDDLGVTYAEIGRLRHADRQITDLERVIDALKEIARRFPVAPTFQEGKVKVSIEDSGKGLAAKVDVPREEDLRLYVTQSNGLTARLIYGSAKTRKSSTPTRGNKVSSFGRTTRAIVPGF